MKSEVHPAEPAGLRPFSPRPLQVMAKPVGSACNLSCQYCYYLEKQAFYEPGHAPRMSGAVLEKFVAEYIGAHAPGERVTFTWQGGEPTLMGLPFFEEAVTLQRRHAGDRSIVNALQTNGTLIDDTWAGFLEREQFLVSVSLDGPKELHDAYRVDRGGRPSFDRAMAGVECLRRQGVEFGTLTVVHRQNSQRPLPVYRFLKEAGSRCMQFLPVVERTAGPAEKAAGLKLAAPPKGSDPKNDPDHMITLWSVRPSDYGEFLCLIFDEWVRRDVGRITVREFASALSQWMDGPATVCAHERDCGQAVALEHDGTVYACDRYVYPEYRLGNISGMPLSALLEAVPQSSLGGAKQGTLPGQCLRCPVLFACNGECPKNRFMHTTDGEAGLNYLCAAYQRFFHHIDAAMCTMASLIKAGRQPAEIMKMPRTRWTRGRV